MDFCWNREGVDSMIYKQEFDSETYVSSREDVSNE